MKIKKASTKNNLSFFFSFFLYIVLRGKLMSIRLRCFTFSLVPFLKLIQINFDMFIIDTILKNTIKLNNFF